MDRSHPEAASLLLGTVHERHTKNDGANTFRKDEHGDTSRPYRDLPRKVPLDTEERLHQSPLSEIAHSTPSDMKKDMF